MAKKRESQILFLGTYPPRECGIATFTQDISNAVARTLFPHIKVKISAMNRNGINIYNYSDRVVHEINDADMDSYIETAKKINADKKIKLVCIQHEFGIFGGEYGNYLIPFLEVLEKPCVITLHSILPNADNSMKKVIQSLDKKIKAFIVMAEKGKHILREQYKVKSDVHVIPHGIPTIPFESSSKEKKLLGYERKTILSSFGMVGPGKGYEEVIESLPEVVKKFPDTLYLVIGETHPAVRKEQGESYRNFLEEKVKRLGLQNNVKFYNKYLTISEIIRYLKATDIYLASNQDPNQITSGTLSYALGAGRPVISTPFLHAQEAVNQHRGLLTKFKDSESFTKSLLTLLDDPSKRKSMEKEAYHYTRSMTWPNVAIAYEQVFNKYADLTTKTSRILPPIKMNHLLKLTDNFGIIQFANNTNPHLDSGYTTDDNARALMACIKYYHHFKDVSKLNQIKIYLNYLNHVQQFDGRILNYVNKDKTLDKERWTEDAHGRALWSLGTLLATPNLPQEIKSKAQELFKKALLPLRNFTSPRAIAFSIIGISQYQERTNNQENLQTIIELTERLISHYKDNSTQEWKWFEKYLTYSNSKLTEAMFHAYQTTNNEKYLEIAEESLNFLNSITFEEDIFVPIGQQGWYLKDGKRAYFDQQPVDVASMVQTLITANKITNKDEYMDLALNTFEWFLGKNSLKQIVYNEHTGGCYDGLGEHSININQGAESTVSYLLARLAFCY